MADERRITLYMPGEFVSDYRRDDGWRLYHWQAQCLLLPKVLRFGNLVYWAPTGGNKSMVAEVLKLCKIASSGKAALLALLFVYLFEEKGCT